MSFALAYKKIILEIQNSSFYLQRTYDMLTAKAG